MIRAVLLGLALTGAPILPPAPAGRQCATSAKTSVPGIPWAQQALAPQRAWVLTRGDGIVVGVVDTGVSAATPALAGVVLPGRDLTGKGPADNDCSGHGTFVAGLLAARPSPLGGFAGVAPGARVLPIRVTADESQVDSTQLAMGIRAAVDGGARVVAVALGTSGRPGVLPGAIAYATARDVLVIASTDTSGLSSDGPVYPAALPGVVAVASIDSSGKATATGTPPALAAPGSNLVSIAPRGTGNVTGSGNGVAVAFIAGTAALVRAYRPTLTAAQVRHRLETTADHPSGRLPDPLVGQGTIDPLAAVATALPEESGEPAPKPHGQPVVVLLPTPQNRHPAHLALLASASVAACAGLAALITGSIRRGRRRGWRPGTSD